MSDVAAPPILDQVALGYAPFVDRKFAVLATRLTVFPLRVDAELDVAQLLSEVGTVFPPGGGQVVLNLVSERLLQDLLVAQPAANVMVEVPAFMVADPANADAFSRLRAHGSALLLKGRPLAELPRQVLPCFRYSIVDQGDDRRTTEHDDAWSELRSIPHVQSGVATLSEMEAAFARGAEAVLGWPLGEPPSAASSARAKPTNLQAVLELMALVEREAPIDAIEPQLKRDPALAFKLLRYINSPAFGLRVEVGSFRHAVMILGYKRLKRWLALLLATAGDEPRIRPAMYAAVRRGFFLEELVRDADDEELRSELFTFGVFSLLDRMFGQPFAALLESIPVPERVREALVAERGPFVPYLELVRAVESGALVDLREAAGRLLLSIGDVNRAQLRALSAAAQLD